MLQSPRASRWLLLPGILTILMIGCSKRLDLPDMGPPLPYSAKLELAPSVTEAKFEYLDNCGHFRPVPIGAELEETLIEAAHRLFKRVEVGPGTQPVDVVIRVDLVNSALNILMDSMYDRPPAEVRFAAVERIHDAAGTLLREPDIQVSRRERVRIEPMQKNCEYILEPFLPNAITEFAMRFAAETRSTLAPSGHAESAPAPSPSPVASGSLSGAPAVPEVPPPAGSLSFKAHLMDENNDRTFEGGERLRVHVDVVNSGRDVLPNVFATLSGPESLLTHFPAATLPIGRLGAGDTKSLDFIATLPQGIPPQRAEIIIRVADMATKTTAPDQTLLVVVGASSTTTDDIDQVPAGPSAFQQPDHYVLAIGLSHYRIPNVEPRKYASLDAQTIAAYFTSLGGVPPSNIRLLQDVKALRPDIEEAVLDWLPARVTSTSTVIVYFAGQALATSTGDIFLIPYEGDRGTLSRLYPLKELEAALARLKAKQIIFIFDGSVLRTGSDRQNKSSPQWQTSKDALVRLIGTSGSGKGFESETYRHGLFTYYLLRGLRGEADADRNQEVTLSEVISYVNQQVPSAARAAFHQDQRPQTIPAFRPRDRTADTVLTKFPGR